MKYTVSIEINKPLKEVVKLFTDTGNYSKWMQGLEKHEILRGSEGQLGTKSRFEFNMGKRQITMTETVIENNLPEIYTVSYEAKGVFNVVKSRFKAKSDTITSYTSEQEFRFKGILKFMALLSPKAFKKQSIKNLQDFKEFVEQEIH